MQGAEQTVRQEPVVGVDPRIVSIELHEVRMPFSDGARASMDASPNGLGMAILSTSRGLMSDSQARRATTGGELLALVW